MLCFIDRDCFYILPGSQEQFLLEYLWVFAFWVSEGKVLLCSMLSITSTDNPCVPPASRPPAHCSYLPFHLRHHNSLVENIKILPSTDSSCLYGHHDQPVKCDSTTNINSVIRADLEMGLTTQLKWIVLGLEFFLTYNIQAHITRRYLIFFEHTTCPIIVLSCHTELFSFETYHLEIVLSSAC